MADGYKLSKQAVQRTAKAVREVLGGVGTPSRRPVPTRRRDRSGAGKKYELLRGTISADTHAATHNVYQLSATPVNLPSGSKPLPTGTLNVLDHWDIGPSIAQEVVCVHELAAYDHVDTGQVDWIILPFGGSDTVKTLHCQLYNNAKAYTSSPVDVKLLDFSGTPVGTEVDAYDFPQEFSSGGATDAFGQVTLFKDADTGLSRLEFINLQGPALYICATLTEDIGETTTGKASADVDDYHGIGWWKEDPGESVNVVSCNGMHDGLVDGTKVIAVLSDPDAATIEYTIIEASGNSLIAKIEGTVSARSGDTLGSGTANLGHPVAGVWTLVLASQTILNPSNLSINVPSGYTIQIPVDLINGEWVLAGALELLSLSGYVVANDQSVGKDADALPEWQDDGDCS